MNFIDMENNSHNSLSNLDSMNVSLANTANSAFLWHILTIGTQIALLDSDGTFRSLR